MHRALYLTGLGYLAICGVVVVRYLAPAPAPQREPIVPGAGPRFDGTAREWFTAIKPYCNSVEVVLMQRQHPAPTSLEGQALAAACYALGGRLDSARAVIDRLPSGDRPQAAGIVFDVAHPVADAGDDRSAGPIMELVVEYWPNHYMALYHAGMSAYALNQPAVARQHLEAFLQHYDVDDGWTQNARGALARLR